jgi:hypothetical protein
MIIFLMWLVQMRFIIFYTIIMGITIIMMILHHIFKSFNIEVVNFLFPYRSYLFDSRDLNTIIFPFLNYWKMIDVLKNKFTLLNFKEDLKVCNWWALSCNELPIFVNHIFQLLILLENFIFIFMNYRHLSLIKSSFCSKSNKTHFQLFINIRPKYTATIIKSSIDFKSL